MNKRILLIDDEEAVRKVMAGILIKAGYDVNLTADGTEAIKFLQSNHADLIILDMNMPRMDGHDFLKYIRDHKITSVPVLMISGSNDPELKAESYKLGVYDFISKPEQTEVMLKRIENGLKIGEMLHFNEFMKTELYMAKKLQTYLYPPLTMETDYLNIRTISKPLSDIGGDLFDYIEFRDGRLMFFIADISGHSISAALYTAIVKMVFRNAIKEYEKPSDVLTAMNRELSGNIPIESFVTMFCGLIDVSRYIIQYSNAGHPLPLHYSEGRISELDGSDSFLGPIENAEFGLFSSNINRGDIICLFTDGTFEISRQGDFFEDQWIREILKKDDVGLDEKYSLFKEKILGEQNNSSDDCTLMMLSVK